MIIPRTGSWPDRYVGRLLRFSYQCAYLLAFPWFAWRVVSGSGWRSLGRRFGRGLGTPLADAIWLHGASAGEIALLAPIIERLDRDYPESPLVISASSSTGYEAARAAYARHRVVECPFDLGFAARRFLRNFSLRLAVFVESELWPSWLYALRERGVPVAIVNGRVSARSFAFHRRTGLVARELRHVQRVAVQTEEHAERMRLLGVADECLFVTGNMKHDLPESSVGEAEAKAFRGQLGFAETDVVLIGGSLHDGEHAAVIDAWSKAKRGADSLQLILVPRYPADAGDAMKEADRRGLAAIRMSELDSRRPRSPQGLRVLVVDMLGQLRRLYAAADIAFVGGSLLYRGSNKGGHNVMEPAVCAMPILVGPYNFSFEQTVRELERAGAARIVADSAALAEVLTELAADPAKRRQMGARARETILESRGATARNYTLLQALLTGSTPNL